MKNADERTPLRVQAHLWALGRLEPPFAYVDLDAFELNAGALLAMAGPRLPIRVATKSIRCTALIDHALGLDPRFHAAMAFTAPEALHLASKGVDDVLIAYPSVDVGALTQIAQHLAEHPGHVIRPMVDCAEHVGLVARAAAAGGAEIPVCIDVDTAWRPAGARGPRIGSRRSPLRTPEQVVALVREIAATDGVRCDALMAYDGQIAGVGNEPVGRELFGRAITLMQRASLAELKRRVPKIVRAVQAELARTGGALAMVNVGGTGSLSRSNAIDGATELTSGSGFFAPALFDTYSWLDLSPAAFFVLPVVRRPAEGVATILGGGYLASGAPGADRLPQPVWPQGLSYDGNEGAGEVQTPLLGEAADGLSIGDRVVLRHAKAGELCERFDRLYLVRGGQVVDVVPTYRGQGLTFL